MKLLRISLLALAAAAATPLSAQQITLYSGRGETLVAPLIETFTARTGIRVDVRYGGTAELAVLLQEEGDASPADVFWAQDVAALGTVADLLAPLPEEVYTRVDANERDAEGRWVGTSGRMRLMIHSTERMNAEDLPGSLMEIGDERFRGRMVLAPTNGSFLAHVTAVRHVLGEEAARDWLQAIADNQPVIVSNNTAMHTAIADGEADFGVTNNYYLSRFLSSDPEYPVAHALFEADDIGNVMMVAGAGVLAQSDSQDEAVQFIDFLLGEVAQQYFTGTVYEYPVVGEAIVPVANLGVSYQQARDAAIEIDLNAITDLEGTLEMLREVGLL